MNLVDFFTFLLLGTLPFCCYMMKFEKSYGKGESYGIALLSVGFEILVGSLASVYQNKALSVTTILLASVCSFLITKNIACQKITILKYFKFMATMILFFFSSAFEAIPVLLFSLRDKVITPELSTYLTTFSDMTLLILLVLFYYDDLKSGFLKLKENFNRIFDESFRIWILGFLGMMVSNLAIRLLVPSAVAGNENTVQSMIDVSPLVMFFCAGLIAPVIEELCFRKAFRDLISNRRLFVFTSGFVFGILHVIFAYTSLLDFVYILPYAALGFSLAYMYSKTDTIFSSIMMHCLHNSLIIGLSVLTGMIV